MNKLISIYRNDVADYFARLGGSGRYLGYREWHSPALILCLLMNLDIDWNISPKMLNNTDGLPTKIRKKLENVIVDKLTFLEFLDFVDEHLKKISTEEFMDFRDIIIRNPDNYYNYLYSLD